MKASMKMILKQFCAHRMVETYYHRFYEPALRQYDQLTANQAKEAVRLRNFHERLRTHWSDISLEQPMSRNQGPFRVGESFMISTEVYLGALTPEEVRVELYYGLIESIDRIKNGQVQRMTVKEDRGDGNYRFECALPCHDAGRFGFTVRVVPAGDDFIKFTPGLITWA